MSRPAAGARKIGAMKIHALITAVASLVSLIASLLANLAALDSLLLIVLAALFVQWHAQRQRQARSREQEAALATMRNLSEEAALLTCSELANRHPELRCELHIFERAVVRCLADAHHGRKGAPSLTTIHRCVTVIAPQLLTAVQTFDDKLTLQSACRQFRHMSQRLLPKIAGSSDVGLDTQFAFNDRRSTRKEPALAPR
jgi:hypothetical protein